MRATANVARDTVATTLAMTFCVVSFLQSNLSRLSQYVWSNFIFDHTQIDMYSAATRLLKGHIRSHPSADEITHYT